MPAELRVHAGRHYAVHIHSGDEHVVPYEIMRWFMEQVADQVERCRVAFEQGKSGALE
ncbi:hypothetical protein ACFZCP_39640 [Streptomyces sp. NPDC007971]|uniref:hypothetical protein n=1 Tax=Streptomyces sp. NPDC007971 TaxID=3364799 RepID=UPI0036EAF7C2